MILVVLDNIVIAQLKINLRDENYFHFVKEVTKLIICYPEVNYRLALSYTCCLFCVWGTYLQNYCRRHVALGIVLSAVCFTNTI